MLHATYIGPDVGWNVTKGLVALLMEGPTENEVLAQFNDFHIQRAGVDLAFGWHLFPRKDFEIDSQGQDFMADIIARADKATKEEARLDHAMSRVPN